MPPRLVLSRLPHAVLKEVLEIATQTVRSRNCKLNRKIDVALLPFMSFLFHFNTLDRGNVGNAQTQGSCILVSLKIENSRLACGFPGFTDDIGAGADNLNFAVSIFFVTFVTFQPFSAAMGRWLGPKHWIPFIMVGLVSDWSFLIL